MKIVGLINKSEIGQTVLISRLTYDGEVKKKPVYLKSGESYHFTSHDALDERSLKYYESLKAISVLRINSDEVTEEVVTPVVEVSEVVETPEIAEDEPVANDEATETPIEEVITEVEEPAKSTDEVVEATTSEDMTEEAAPVVENSKGEELKTAEITSDEDVVSDEVTEEPTQVEEAQGEEDVTEADYVVSALESMYKKAELEELAQSLGLEVTGTKRELAEAICEADLEYVKGIIAG